ncbi:aminotransferase class I/II-fold pyridoxal phosphate-dependent enzyme [Pseudenhygromyxa sp. WMMC2535]|uniref:trans-sulfuration enzyme family protein n=1 Tax=Pseudenhygromyxa sp. WMMC2535 TaxID=2712867 RepID=UPI0015544331|nr:aminotransferase class I/II-fold pyridoxal phosphate-dependent enzyme [Pseudenhygromyxa sp. WMMC2535]NVB42346.1 aminotransferase class I/II-fold pyridoxal phosphate-dependent enzyme [Pseudenhygromyxa sp. WMMC2535]
MSRRPSLSTLLIHPRHGLADAPSQTPAELRPRGSAPTLDRSSTFPLAGPGGEALASGRGLREHDVYGRFGTSTTREAAAAIARLEGAEAALLTASGMAAIATALTTLIPPGGRFVCGDVVYGGVESLIAHELPARGIETTRFDARDPASLAACLDPAAGREPALVWCESITNPLMGVARVRELAALCRGAGVPLAVDATFAGGMAQHPLALGASLVVHSATKYLNGHGDVVAGVIIGDRERVDACFSTLARTGCCIDPQAAWLLARGLQTLPLRWAQQCANAAILAQRLRDHAAVRALHWPGFDPDALAAAPLDAGGAMLSFELAAPERAAEVLARVRLCTHAASLGGLETLICSPARTSHAQLDAQTRRARGIVDGLLRLSVGVEDPEDIWADLDAALS